MLSAKLDRVMGHITGGEFVGLDPDPEAEAEAEAPTPPAAAA